MTKYLVEEQTLTDIADAIREQTGDENPIMLSNFASQIASIQGGSSMNYSTTEHEVGTWVDGKTIYSKTIAVEQDNQGDHYYSCPTGIDQIWFDPMGSFMTSSSGDVVYLGYYVGNNDRFVAHYDATNNRIDVHGSWSGTGYITILYTKTSA